MERKHKIELGLAILVILALALVLYFLLRPTIPMVEEEAVTLDTPPVVEQGASSEVTGSAVFGPASALTVSRVFVERLGSFSSEGGYENLEVIQDIATPALAARLEAISRAALQETGAVSYYGVSTRFISAREVSLSDTRAEYKITTQRVEAIAIPDNTQTRYQDISLVLLKTGEDWLVDDFTWLD